MTNMWAAMIYKYWRRNYGCRILCTLTYTSVYEKIMKFISVAKSGGATILRGERRPQHLKKGFFIEPATITNVDTSMQIWREEVFGPVFCVKTFKTEEETIDLGNDTEYGLAAAVISDGLERCERMTQAFQTCIVWVNCWQSFFCQLPWGGIKRSGFGRYQVNVKK
ncbi:hypothetical protein MKX01_004329 [Papaver californicum]|nr:hypothetical protein MKX01_004329 [Papaver californicum]